jgi:ATP-dependent DNA ligase
MSRGRSSGFLDIERGILSVPEAASSEDVVDRIPEGSEWRFEPDWDGLRVTARFGPGVARLVSDRGRDFDRFFPEVVRALADLNRPDTVVAGSMVVVGPEGMSYAGVRRRLHPSASRVGRLAEVEPATFVITELLRAGGVVFGGQPQAVRRRALEAFAKEESLSNASSNLGRIAPGVSFAIAPQTKDRSVARAWLVDRDATGRDGVIARHEDGERAVLVRRARSASCVVLGYRASRSHPVGALRLGLFDDRDRLVEVGRTTALDRASARRVAESALAAVAPRGSSGGSSMSWIDVPPRLVCEVRYERLRGSRFRHAARLLRWQPDRDPATCRTDQLR